MSDFLSKVQISNKNLYCKELKVRHHKIILKSLFGDSPDYESVFTNIDNILSELTSLDIKEIKQFNVVEYFLLLFEIRNLSIGSTIAAETTDKKAVKVSLNINKFSELLRNINLDNLLTSENIDEYIFHYKLPTITDIVDINNDLQKNIYSLFVKSLTLNSMYIDFTKLDYKSSTLILESLPAKVTYLLNKHSQQIITHFNDINLLSYLPGLKDKQLIFNFNIDNLGSILKLLFGEHLLTLYTNIFNICRLGNLSPEYIENCTPGEYILFAKKIEELQQVNKSSQLDDSSLLSNPYDYPDVPAQITRSEFPSMG